MKPLLIFFFLILLYSCSSTKDVKSSEVFNDPRKQLNDDIIISCSPTYYEVEFDTEIISHSFNTTKDSLFFEGKLYDAETKEPLIGAEVSLLPCSIITYTDIDGYYKFEFQSNECDSIKIRYIGYATNTLAIKDLIKY